MEGRRKRRWRVVEEKSMERGGREERKRGWRVVEEKVWRGEEERRGREGGGWRREDGKGRKDYLLHFRGSILQ